MTEAVENENGVAASTRVANYLREAILDGTPRQPARPEHIATAEQA